MQVLLSIFRLWTAAVLVVWFGDMMVVAAEPSATISETTIEIPTYPLGPDDKNPPLNKPEVYPYAMQTAISGEAAVPQSYQAVVLENRWIRVIVLPELGGRIWAAHDKTNHNYDFIYQNRVIKPALVAPRGAWVSGGVQWNVAGLGNSVNTFAPVPYELIRRPDGAVSCVVGATEWVRRMHWSIEITLPPDRAYFSYRVCLINPTLTHNRGYFWANAAVHAWEGTRITFPPTAYTFGRRRVSPQSWPLQEGVDVAWVRNVLEPRDYFSGTPGDFLAAYNHQRDCGTVHVAAAEEALGRKFRTWGTGAVGKLWERLLTDEDGPSIELQSGRLWTQGDTWCFEPQTQQAWREYWYPVRGLRGLVTANRDVAVNLAVGEDAVLAGIIATRPIHDATVRVYQAEHTILEREVSLEPASPWKSLVRLPAAAESGPYRLELVDSAGQLVVSYTNAKAEVPPPDLEPAFPPDAECSVEQLCLKAKQAKDDGQIAAAIGLFETALERDPGHSPALRSLAVLRFKQGLLAEAAQLADKALHRNEDDPTARYYRALARMRLGLEERVDEDLALVGRRAAYRHVAPYLQAARAVASGEDQRALNLLTIAVRENRGNLRARCLLAALLRRLGRETDARRVVDDVLRESPVYPLAVVEMGLQGDETLLDLLEEDAEYYVESACAYMEMNLDGDAIAALAMADQRDCVCPHPMLYFYLGYLSQQLGQTELARDYYARGDELDSLYILPFRDETIDVLNTGLALIPTSWKMRYYLGTLLASRRRGPEALEHLEAAAAAEPDAPVVYRNLAEVYWHATNDTTKATEAYELAVLHDPADYTYYLALDRLYKLAGQPERRAVLYEQAPEAVKADFRVQLRRAEFLVESGQLDAAIEILLTGTFHPAKGSTGAHDLYVRALRARAERSRAAGQYGAAAADLQAAMAYPENLGAARPHDADALRPLVELGRCCEQAEQPAAAVAAYRRALEASGHTLPAEDAAKLKAEAEAASKRLGPVVAAVEEKDAAAEPMREPNGDAPTDPDAGDLPGASSPEENPGNAIAADESGGDEKPDQAGKKPPVKLGPRPRLPVEPLGPTPHDESE